jgi:hypothetical protein
MSSAFPVVASLMNVAEMPRVLGIADVVMAAVLVATALAMQGRATALVRDVDRRTAYVVIRAGSAAAPGAIPDWPPSHQMGRARGRPRVAGLAVRAGAPGARRRAALAVEPRPRKLTATAADWCLSSTSSTD